MGALYAFELCKPKFVSLPTDDEGLNPDLIDDRVAGAKFAYVMQTYQNPTGRTISEERRRKRACGYGQDKQRDDELAVPAPRR